MILYLNGMLLSSGSNAVTHFAFQFLRKQKVYIRQKYVCQMFRKLVNRVQILWTYPTEQKWEIHWWWELETRDLVASMVEVAVSDGDMKCRGEGKN